MTIEERAIKAFPCDPCSMAQSLKEIHGLHCDHCNRLERIDDYVKGATEQRQIDIDKACEWLRENVRPYHKFSIESFRKAMEEEQC